VFGARVPRKEDARLITGRGRYVSDVELPRMLHVAFVRSVHAHARIRGIETTRAAAAPGVVAVMTGADPDLAKHRLRALSALPTYVETEQPILAWPKVRFAGEAVVAVVARDRYAAGSRTGTRARASSPSGPAPRSRTWPATVWPGSSAWPRIASGSWRPTWAAGSG
jgi:CO/xanthine dehydrogenase Mo-binding subunit